MSLHIKNFRLFSTASPSIYIPKKGYTVSVLIEGSSIGSTYYSKLPLQTLPLFAYSPKTQKVFNKIMTIDMKKLKNDYGKSISLYYDPKRLKSKTFVYDITPYIYFLKQKLAIYRFANVSMNFMLNSVEKLRASENEQILIYYVDPSIIEDGVRVKNLFFYIFLKQLSDKNYNLPYDKIFIYAKDINSSRLIYDRALGEKNQYARVIQFVKMALKSKHITDDDEKEEIIGPIATVANPVVSSTVNSNVVKNASIPKPEKDIPPSLVTDVKEKPLASMTSTKVAPKIIDKVAIVKKDGIGVNVTNAVLPVAKKDPIKKGNNAFTVNKAQVMAAISDIVKNSRSIMNAYNVNSRTLANRLNALTRANPVAAHLAVSSFDTQSKLDQIAIAKAAITPERSDTTSAVLVPEPTEDIQKQEVIAHNMGLDKEESIDYVNDNKVIDKLLKNDIALAIARRHDYQTKIVNDIHKSVERQLIEVGYKVSKVWFSQTETPGTEIYESKFDMLNIKCIDSAGKTVLLKFRVPAMLEDRYVKSGGLKWFYPTIMATLPIFIVKKFQSQFHSNYGSISFFYGVFNKQVDVRCYVGGYKLPLALLYSLVVGVEGTLRRYGINYIIMETKPRDSSKISFQMGDGKFLVCDIDAESIEKRIILTGLRMMFRKYRFRELNSTQELFNCLRAYTQEPKSEYILRQTLKYIIDVQILNVLTSNHLPTTLKDIIPYCAELAVSGKVSDKLSIENVYLRTTDIITTAIDKGVAQGVANFKYQHMHDPEKQIHVDQSFVSNFFRDKGALQQLQQQNPIEEVSNYAAVRIVGPGGLPNADAVMPRDRAVRNSHFGNLDPSDTSEGDPGTRIFMSLGHMYDEKQHGFMPMELNPSNTQIMGPAASTTPYVDANDQARTIMSCSQARQAVPIQSSELPIIMTGAESIIPSMTSSTFAKKADDDSTVEYVDDNVIIMKNNNGNLQAIDMRPETLISGSGKNAAIEQKPLVKVGDKVKKFQIVAQNQFIKPYLTQGINASCAYMSYNGYNYEDGFVISQSFADKLVSTHSEDIDITLQSNDQIEVFPKIGQEYNTGDQILNVKKSIVGNMALSEDLQIIAPEKCKITDIKFYPNGDVNQVASLIKNVEDYYRQTNKALAYAGKQKLFDARKIIANAGKYTDHGDLVEGNKIIITMISYMPTRLGDKLANRHGGKGVVTTILPDDKMPITESGVRIDVIYPNLCVVGRMNVGQLHELGSSRVMVEATKKLDQMYKSNAKRIELEKFIDGLYEGLDNTSGKVYSTQLSRNMKSMNDAEFKIFVEDAIKNKLKLIAAPFQGDTIEQLMKTADKLGLKFYEYLRLPELGKNVKTMYPVAVGYMYMYKLEQIAKLKSHARNTGRYVKTSMQPTRGKAQAGGMRFSEMDTWCVLAYPEGKEMIDQLYATSSDNWNIKQEVLSDIIQTGHADISSEVKLSGAGEYFNAIITGMGINIDG